MFVTTLRSNGHCVTRAKDEFDEGVDDEQLLRFCAREGHVLITHDKKDFSGQVHEAVVHAGIVVYTDATYLHSALEDAVRTLEQVTSLYPLAELANNVVWLDQWR